MCGWSDFKGALSLPIRREGRGEVVVGGVNSTVRPSALPLLPQRASRVLRAAE